MLFKIYTLGCKVNQYESHAIEHGLLRQGLGPAGKNQLAQISLINTCAVTHVAAHQSRQAISRLERENPEGTVIITGCYADLYPEELLSHKGKRVLIPNRYKLSIPSLINQYGMEINHSILNSLEILPFPTHPPCPKGRAKAYLKIQDGCEARCSYCVVPMARGGYKSLDGEEVIKQLLELSSSYGEIILTGIHLSKYGADLKDTGLIHLLRKIDHLNPGSRIRVSSLEPNEISDELLELILGSHVFCKHLHIPLQSGSNPLLKKMNRSYEVEDYRDLVVKASKMEPTVGIGSDVIVGFPGEDEKAFQDTYKLIESLPISYLHVFPYSPRKGTESYSLTPMLAHEIIKARAAKLRDLGLRKKRAFLESQIGLPTKMLVEKRMNKGLYLGHTTNYVPSGFYLEKDLNIGTWVEGKGDRIVGDILILKGVRAI